MGSPARVGTVWGSSSCAPWPREGRLLALTRRVGGRGQGCRQRAVPTWRRPTKARASGSQILYPFSLISRDEITPGVGLPFPGNGIDMHPAATARGPVSSILAYRSNPFFHDDFAWVGSIQTHGLYTSAIYSSHTHTHTSSNLL